MRFAGLLPIWVVLLAGGQSPVDQRAQAYRSGYFSEGVAYFKTAVAQNPADVKAHLALAAAYSAQWVPGLDTPPNSDNLTQAIAEYLTVLQLDPSNRNAFGSLGQLAYNQATTGDKSKLDESAEWYRKLVSVDANNEQGRYFLGVVAWSKSYPPVTQARQRLALPADFKGPLPDRTVRESLADQYDSVVEEGVENLREALAIKPNDEDAMTYLNLLLRVRSGLNASAEASARDLAEADHWSLLSLETRRQKQTPPAEQAVQNSAIIAPPPPPPPAPEPDHTPEIGAQEAESNLQSKTDPAYPALALSARVQGSVAFRIIIGEDGRVKRTMLQYGHPLLVNAAREAIFQYVYRPFLVDGRPTTVSTEVTVQFSRP